MSWSTKCNTIGSYSLIDLEFKATYQILRFHYLTSQHLILLTPSKPHQLLPKVIFKHLLRDPLVARFARICRVHPSMFHRTMAP
jgi:hypothetical protein